MQQILQNLGSGETLLAEVPRPLVRAGHLLIRTEVSLVSVGTEKMLIDFGKSGLLDKARKQPEKVKQVLAKVKTDGLFPTVDAVRSKLDQPIGLGYCNVGIVEEIGTGTDGFNVGDRVLSNGAHAEYVVVPQNLCAGVPDGVAPEKAVFTVVGSIGLQGIRLIEPTLGETVVVMGLGLIGLLSVELILAQGCRVIGIDFDSEKCAKAAEMGAIPVDLTKVSDPVSKVVDLCGGTGADAVLITASTKSNDPIHHACEMSRKRGRIVLVGVVGMQMDRADFYEKELSFQVSCSYGPGRYDPAYEQGGQDYPLPFVRWTEQRNFEAILGLMEAGRIDPEQLITSRHTIVNAVEAYEMVLEGKELGVLLEYPAPEADTSHAGTSSVVELPKRTNRTSGADVVIGAIGAGNFAGRVLLPALSKTDARLKLIASSAGVTGTHHGTKLGFEQSTTDTALVLDDKEVNAVVVTTRHDSHAELTLRGLRAGKAVFVEKPLCLFKEELAEIESLLVADPTARLMVGYNRRFAPLAEKMWELLEKEASPKSIVYTANAGAIPPDVWVHDRVTGGGRILGEACHFVDFCRKAVGFPIVEARMVSSPPTGGLELSDTAIISLRFEDGSIATVNYFANGHNSYPKETVEVFGGGKILRLDNFRTLTGFGFSGFRKKKVGGQDKGHIAGAKLFVESVKTGIFPIPLEEILEIQRVCLGLVEDGSYSA